MVELIFCLAIGISAVGVGNRIFRRLAPNCQSVAEELSFSLGLGVGVLALSIMALGLLQLLYESSLYLLLIACGYVGRRELAGLFVRLKGRSGSLPIRVGSLGFWLLIFVGVGVVLNLSRALTPVYGHTDPLAYNLALPKIFLQSHALTFQPTMTGALYPSNIGMLFTLGIGLRGPVLAQVIHFLMGMSCLFFLVSFCRSFFSDRVGVLAAAFFSFTPVLVYYAPLGYVDAGLCFFQFLAIWALFNGLDREDNRFFLISGILTGLALGSKHAAIPMWFLGLVLIVGVGLIRRNSPSGILMQCGLFGVVALALASPWYLRSYLEAGNPVWPLGNAIFEGHPYRGTFSTGSVPRGTSAVSSMPSLPSADRLAKLIAGVATAFWNWSWMPDWQRAVGIYHVVFLPGLLLYARDRRVLFLGFFCALYYGVSVLRTDGNPRYSMFLFAYVSVLSAFVADKLLGMKLRTLRPVLMVGIATSFLLNLGLNFALAEKSIDYHLSGSSRDRFLSRREGNYRVFQVVNKHLPKSSKLLLQGIVKGFYCDRPYIWDHPHQLEVNYRQFNTHDLLIKRLRELGISHVVRMINIPPIRTEGLGYPQYFADSFHENFRKKYLKIIYRDESYVLFEIKYPPELMSIVGEGNGSEA